MTFEIHPSTTGKELFDKVTQTIGVHETWWFALQYTDSKDRPAWLNLKKKISAQNAKKDPVMQLQLRARYFPEDISSELIEDVTLRLFCLQIKESILNSDWYCPAEVCVMLAAYSLFAKF